ncbi:unnamed protein product [Victoria cruziana]
MAESQAPHHQSFHTVVQLEMMNKLPTTVSASGQQKGKEAQGNKNKIGGIGTKRGALYWVAVVLDYLCISVGSVASALLSKLYFVHGGSRRWISCLTQSAAFPLLFVPLAISHYKKPSSGYKPFSCFTPKVLLFTILLGLILGFDNFTYAWGISYIPVSIATLLLSSQLAFTALFACLIVKQPMNFTTLNCILLLTLSSALVGITSSHETPAGVTTFQYAMGVVSTMITAVLYGLYLPLLELLNNNFRKKQVAISFSLVLETQIVILATASTFSFVGMAASGDLKRIMAEAEEFDLGQVKYWLCLVFGAISWQMNLVGSAGFTFLTSSLVTGICTTALIPANVVSPVIFFHEAFSAEKGFSVILSIWGFFSYLFGEYKQNKDRSKGTVQLQPSS